MFTALLIFQVVLALSIIGLVLLQQGKGADMGAAFGSGASGTVFGARGSGSFFSRATAIIAALFFINSVLLSSPLVLGERHPTSSITDSVVTQPEPQPSEDTGEAVDMPPADLPEVDSEGAAKDMPATDDMPEAPAPVEAAGDKAAPAKTDAGDTPAAAEQKPE
jgi:preprotein translocase subunit SecG